MRFRKSIKLAPGIRMNLSGGGLSWTLGPRGASIGIGKRGAFLNTGIPGTGFYSRDALIRPGSASASMSRVPSPTTTVSLTVSVSDDGVISFKDSNGNPVSETLIDAAKKQKGDVIRGLIQGKCDEINGQVEALGELHLHTPPPGVPPTYQLQRFDLPRPVPPVQKVPGFFAKFFKSSVEKIDTENAKALADFKTRLHEWEVAKDKFDAAEEKKLELVSKAVSGNSDAMETFFGEILMDIVWPRETIVSFEVQDGGAKLGFDVDLPELEDMPTKTASVPQRGYKLSVKELGPTSVQKMYAKHIHSIGFRLLGEAFAMLPTVQRVTLSGYSQRKNRATGHEQDDYLFSVVVQRSSWEQIDFGSLRAIDVLEAFTRFEMRREMTKTGVFKAIQPF